MPVVRVTPFPAPLDSTEAALRLARTPGLAWLDGGLSHGREGRFSYVATAPCEVLESALDDPQPLALLARLRGAECMHDDGPWGAAEELPLWVGHVSYDAGLSHALRRARKPTLPALRFARYDAWYVFDHAQHCAYLVADDDAAHEQLRARLCAPPCSASELAHAAGPIDATRPELHERAILAALSLIREGDVYEINLARRFSASFAGSALGLFLRMRELSPVPLGYFVADESHAVLGRSMERFLRYRTCDRELWTSPIKGTLAREGDAEGEAARLRADPKEQAEHAMVVDLMRNDLSRVCELGSVSIAELMTVLPFAGLSHLISTVRGTARAQVDLHELLRCTFPPGSVTGAPKERVVRAIEELEQDSRGLYTGCYGFIDRSLGCSLAVAIRTAVVERDRVTYWAGGGIVADSDPAREVQETELKASLFVRALGHGGGAVEQLLQGAPSDSGRRG